MEPLSGPKKAVRPYIAVSMRKHGVRPPRGSTAPPVRPPRGSTAPPVPPPRGSTAPPVRPRDFIRAFLHPSASRVSPSLTSQPLSGPKKAVRPYIAVSMRKHGAALWPEESSPSLFCCVFKKNWSRTQARRMSPPVSHERPCALRPSDPLILAFFALRTQQRSHGRSVCQLASAALARR